MTIDVYELDDARPWAEVDDDDRDALAWLDDERPVEVDEDYDRAEL